MFLQDTAAHPTDELSRSDSPLADESIGVSHSEPDAMDPVEPAVVSTGGDTDGKATCGNVMEETKTAPHDLTNKPVSMMLEHLHTPYFLL